MNKNKVILIILDGYGETSDSTDNAVTQSKSPFLHGLFKQNHIRLKASGLDVGLPEKTMGNSEVGHFTIGCGQIRDQSLVRINKSISNKEFYNIELFVKSIKKIKDTGKKIHVTCLLSDTGIHGQINHLDAVCKIFKENQIQDFYLHGILDGRDVPQKSAEKYIKITNEILKTNNIGQLVSLCGRYYAMDRDQNYERTKLFYDLITKPEKYNLEQQINWEEKYEQFENDYYIKPIKLKQYEGLVSEDLFVNMNFRTDRQEQLTQSLEDTDFDKFEANIKPNLITFGDYGSKKFNIFPTPLIKTNLGSILEENDLKQARIAETEKFAHVTYFFNSQNKQPYKGEDRFIIESDKIANYKDNPLMKAKQITSKLKEIVNKNYNLIVVNYANPDLVGHSGDLEATKKGIEEIDKNLSEIVPIYLENNFTVLITSDHGNAEDMEHNDNTPNPSHTTNDVPFFVISNSKINLIQNKDSGLKNIAPTILKLLEIEIPKYIKSKSLI